MSGRIAGALSLGALMGAMALQVQADARAAERAAPPRGRILELGGTRLHLLDAGPVDGPPVLLLHGNVVTAEDFVASGVFGALARHHRVIAPDRPGYGHSDRPRGRDWGAGAQAALFAAVLARFGLGPAVVVGHSWGTLPAIGMALDHPGAVRGLVLVSGYHLPTRRADAALVAPLAVPLLGDAMRHGAAPLAGRLVAPMLVRAMFRPQAVPGAFSAGVPLGLMLRPGQLRASAEDGTAMRARAKAVRGRYGALGRVPVAILAGAEDVIVDPGRHSVALHLAVPGSRCEVLPGVGHMLHHAAPRRVVQAVGEVLAGWPEAGEGTVVRARPPRGWAGAADAA